MTGQPEVLFSFQLEEREKLTNFQPTPTEDTEYLTLKAEENTPNSIEFFIFLNLNNMDIEMNAYNLDEFHSQLPVLLS